MTSKLTRFKSGLPLPRAAQWLESLIGEAASADDLFDLYLDGHLNISIGGPFTGIPVEEPFPGKRVWTLIREPIVNGPDKIFTFNLNDALQMIDTELGEAPAHCLNGVTYAWFVDRSDHGEILSFDEACERLTIIEPFELVQVHPEEILRIADLANSTLPSTSMVPPPRENRIWSLNENEETIFHKVSTINGSHVRSIKANNSRGGETLSSYPVIAALIGLIAKPSRTGLNQSAIISEMLETYPHKRGFSKRNLEKIFSIANKTMKDRE